MPSPDCSDRGPALQRAGGSASGKSGNGRRYSISQSSEGIRDKG